MMYDIIETLLDGFYINDDIKSVLAVVFAMFVIGSIISLAKSLLRLGR